MTTNIALRRSLRKIPELRFLTPEQLASVMEQMTCKEYRAGEVLWRAGNHLDFLGVIQSGEMIVEYQINRSATRSARLKAGDYIKPRDLKLIHSRSSVTAYAVTDLRLCVLRMQQLSIAASKASSTNEVYSMRWRRLWTVIVMIGILFITWADMSRILSGILTFASDPANVSTRDYQRALTFLRYAEAFDPEATFAHNQEGYIWYQQNNSQSAKVAFTRALEIDQGNGSALNNLAVMHFMQGQDQQAILWLQKAVEHEPNRSLLRYNLGIALASQKRYKEAIREFKEAAYIEPNWALPYLEQGFIYIEMQDYLNAEKAARAAVHLDPGQPSAHLILAIALYNQENSQEALTSVENALQIHPDDEVARFYKALILSKLGEFEPALSILQQLLALTDDPLQAARITAEMEALHRYLENPLWAAH